MLSRWAFLAQLQKKFKIRFLRCNSSITVRSLRSTVKLCFQELQHRNLTTKIGSLSFTKKCCHSISAGYFCKDPRKFVCFRTFGEQWSCLIMKTLKNPKFDTYWLTLVYTNQRRHLGRNSRLFHQLIHSREIKIKLQKIIT